MAIKLNETYQQKLVIVLKKSNAINYNAFNGNLADKKGVLHAIRTSRKY